MTLEARAETFVRLALEAALRGDLSEWEFYSAMADMAFAARSQRLKDVLPGDSTSVN